MRRSIIEVTEQGEGHITNALLLGVLSDTVYNGLLCGDLDSPTFTYITAALNILGKLGWLDVRAENEPPRSAADPGIKTDQPPPFLLDAFRSSEKEDGEDGKQVQG
jgi:hypothetical protein